MIIVLYSITDVYSYAEDELVEDPWLSKHLAHFGINVAQLEKVCYFYFLSHWDVLEAKYIVRNLEEKNANVILKTLETRVKFS